MDTVKIYKCTCLNGIYHEDKQESIYSLMSWGENNDFKEYDEWYILPDGYSLMSFNLGIKEIYNSNKKLCPLITVDGKPAIDDPDKEYFVFIRKLEDLYGEFGRDYGFYFFDDKPYWLTQPAYVIGDGSQYEAQAIDIVGNIYRIIWNVTDEWDEREDFDKEDESEACDWSNPVSIEFISTAENWEG